MDFHSLSRKELQALCKRNSIHANMTNAAMADALAALGELQEEEDQQQYLSPKKAGAGGSPEPPKTGRRTSTRLSSRHAAPPQGCSPLPRSRRVTARAPGVLNLDDEGNAAENGVPETPRAPVTARKGVNTKEERTVGVTTRRRARQPSADVVAVGSISTRRSTRGKAAAATKMADLKSKEEEEEEEEEENAVTKMTNLKSKEEEEEYDVAKNVAISSGPAMEEDIGSKEPEGEEKDSLKIAEMAVLSLEESKVTASDIVSNIEKNVAREEKCDEQEKEEKDILEASDEFSEEYSERELKEEENVQVEEATVENSKKDQNGEEGEGTEEEEGREESDDHDDDDDDDYEEVTYECLEETKKPVEIMDESEETNGKHGLDGEVTVVEKVEANKKEEEERVTITLTKAELDSISLRKLKAMYKDIKMKEGEEKRREEKRSALKALGKLNEDP